MVQIVHVGSQFLDLRLLLAHDLSCGLELEVKKFDVVGLGCLDVDGSVESFS